MYPKDYIPKDHVAVRLDSATLGRVDALKAVFSTPWHEATRSDILRAVILTGLESLEQAHGLTVVKQQKATEPSATERSPTGSRPPVDKKVRPPLRTD